MPFSINSIQKAEWFLKIFYGGTFLYNIVDFSWGNKLPSSFFYFFWNCVFSPENMVFLGIFGLLFFYVTYISLFIRKGKWKYALNFLLEIILIIDVVLILASIPWDAYNLNLGKYAIRFGCIIWDCVFFAAVAFGFYVDHKIISLKKEEKQVDHEKGGGE